MALAIQPGAFEVNFSLDCKRLCADFREDIEFHFTLGAVHLLFICCSL
jgi:hypothetical protein